MAKKVAVLIKDNQVEGFRMAVGLTLADDEVNVFLLDKKLESGESIDPNVEMLGDLDVKIFSNNPENKFEQKTNEEIARALTGYDAVIPY
ncbi:MAG: hypothetical protein FD156_2670 [Nitrospirae bacterium]|nr:MAG: hypothetical protein FD156_2670 [Nitrospirota bacterium]